MECPLHGAEFDLKTGEAVTLPATKPVATYEITVEDEVIYLEMEDNA
ncbi:MAG: Rieske 2Fe-2S domain-containing protein [Actinomycetota bacterium]|nr:Rieske 2Fe-2S domain-containing protein [Actinomycetota bacterium]